MKLCFKEYRYKTMIKLEINQTNLINQLNSKMAGLEEILKPSSLQEISKAIFTITGERFVLASDSYARSNKKAMHHVYEWGQVGSPDGRLFVINLLAASGGSLDIGYEFLQSKLPVPIDPQLRMPGSTGKVVNSESIFRDKAEVMESGKPVQFVAKKVLAFMGNNGIAFIAKGTPVNILNPGGSKTKNSFHSFMVNWYVSNAGLIMDSSGFYERIVNDVALALNKNNAGSDAIVVQRAIAKISQETTQGREIIK